MEERFLTPILVAIFGALRGNFAQPGVSQTAYGVVRRDALLHELVKDFSWDFIKAGIEHGAGFGRTRCVIEQCHLSEGRVLFESSDCLFPVILVEYNIYFASVDEIECVCESPLIENCLSCAHPHFFSPLDDLCHLLG